MNIILASVDGYNHDDPNYDTLPGKIYQQNLHHWYHFSGQPKGYYGKDRSSGWYYFYNAMHKNPPVSEKILSWYKNGGGNNSQIWAYIMKNN